jgi:hypothetical protein
MQGDNNCLREWCNPDTVRNRLLFIMYKQKIVLCSARRYEPASTPAVFVGCPRVRSELCPAGNRGNPG